MTQLTKTFASSQRRARGLRGWWLAVAPVVLIAAAGCQATKTFNASGTDKPVASGATFGVYAGAGRRGMAQAEKFDAAMGAHSRQILDFAAGDDWYNLEGPSWLLDPHRGEAARLEYSLPMFPGSNRKGLLDCAAGDYGPHWATLAAHLVADRLENSVIRPGWEFNAGWYPWSATGRANAYVECFRAIVRGMRSAHGQHFKFDWNPFIGRADMNAEDAYPGDGFVDYVGVDVYDMNPAQYRNNLASPAVAVSTWLQFLDGDHGLRWWSNFAGSHGKRLSLTEWGVTHRADGSGGGDDAAFIDHIFDFITSHCSRIGYALYFNFGNQRDTHDLIATPYFPRSRMRLRQRIQSMNRHQCH